MATSNLSVAGPEGWDSRDWCTPESVDPEEARRTGMTHRVTRRKNDQRRVDDDKNVHASDESPRW